MYVKYIVVSGVVQYNVFVTETHCKEG